MKSSKRIKDNDIPIFLGAVGIIICGLYVIATCDLSGMQSISMALFTAVVQGILVAGLSTYVNHLTNYRIEDFLLLLYNCSGRRKRT